MQNKFKQLAQELENQISDEFKKILSSNKKIDLRRDIRQNHYELFSFNDTYVYTIKVHYGKIIFIDDENKTYEINQFYIKDLADLLDAINSGLIKPF